MTSFRDDSSTDDKDQELASLFSMWSLSNVLDSKGDSEDSTHGGTEDTRYADSLGPLGEGGGLFSSDPFTSDGFDATSMAFSAPLATSLRNAKVTSGTSTFLGSETTVLDDASRLLEGRPTHPSSAQELQEGSGSLFSLLLHDAGASHGTVSASGNRASYAHESAPQVQQAPEAEHSNLYVSNIPETWNDRALKAHFSSIGSVIQCRVLPSKAVAPGLSGLVMMADVPTAIRAIELLNRQIPPGGALPLMVRFASCKVPPKKKKRASHPANPMLVPAALPRLPGHFHPAVPPAAPPAAPPPGAPLDARPDALLPWRSLVVWNLSPAASDADVAALFVGFHPLESVTLLPDHGGHSLTALVTLPTPQAAQSALVHLVATYRHNISIQLAAALTSSQSPPLPPALRGPHPPPIPAVLAGGHRGGRAQGHGQLPGMSRMGHLAALSQRG